MLKVALGDILRDPPGKKEDREYEEQRQSGLEEGLFQMYQTLSGVSGRNRFDKRDEELEQKDEELKHLCRLVRDLELEM